MSIISVPHLDRVRSLPAGLPPFQIDWWQCMPEPLSPWIGFGMKVAVLP